MLYPSCGRNCCAGFATTRRVPQSWNSIGRLSMLLLEPIETKDFAKRVHRFLFRDFPEVFALYFFVLIEELIFCFIGNERCAFAQRGFGDCGAWAESLHIT